MKYCAKLNGSFGEESSETKLALPGSSLFYLDCKRVNLKKLGTL